MNTDSMLLSLPVTTRLSQIEWAILQTVAYSDVFDYPLTDKEIHRYLVGVSAPLAVIEDILRSGYLAPAFLEYQQGYYTLPGRGDIVQIRQRRAAAGKQLWPRVLSYGRIMARLPYVRMVAVTGALAMDNEEGRDMDYLIVTKAGRLWLCRGMVLVLARWAARHGDMICPNYFVTEQKLVFSSHDLYTAHELAQMVPLFGLELYWKIRRLNDWAGGFLPNAAGLPRKDVQLNAPVISPALQSAAEVVLSSPLGGYVEAWEMKRKLRKFNALRQEASEADFCADWCKGHFGGYGGRTLTAYADRLRSIEAGFS